MAGEIAVVGVVGAGTMGAGIAQVALEAGHEVVLYDVDEIARERGVPADPRGPRTARRQARPGRRRGRRLGRRAARRLRHAHTLEALGAEARLGSSSRRRSRTRAQADVFRALDAATEPDVILATNTSALSVAEIAEATRRRRSAWSGSHFFNPAPVLPLVEVVAGRGTRREAVGAAAIDRRGAGARRRSASPTRPGSS